MATLTADNTVSPVQLLQHNVTNGSLQHGEQAVTTSGGGSSAPPHIQAIYISIGVIGMIGNLFVLVVLGCSRGRIRPKMTIRYITNQAALDLATSIVLAAGASVDSGELPDGQVAALLYCKLWVTKILLWGLLVSSTYNLVAVTIERYTALIRPLWHHVSFTDNKATLSMVLIWVIGIGFNAAYMIPTTYVVANNGTTVCVLYDRWPTRNSRNVFGVAIVVLQFFVPLAVIITCYIHMAYTLRMRHAAAAQPRPTSSELAKMRAQNRKNLHLIGVTGTSSGSATNSPHSSNENLTSNTSNGRQHTKPVRIQTVWGRARRNTIKTLALVSACFVLCWISNQVYYTMLNTGYPVDLSSGFYHFTVVAVFANCCLNPFIYMLQFEQFQKAARRVVCVACRYYKDTPATSTNPTTSSSN